MSHRSRTRFEPTLSGVRLEERLALSGMHAIVSIEAAKAKAKPAKPIQLLTPQNVKVKFTTDAINAVGAAYLAFQKAETQAIQTAIAGLSNGQNEANLIAGLRSSTGLQGGILETKLLNIAARFHGGVADLYNAQVTGSTASVTNRTPKGQQPVELNPVLFIPANQRLQAQANGLINSILTASTVQEAANVIQGAPPTFSNTPIQPTISMTSMAARGSITSYLQHMVKAGYLFTS